MAVRAGTSDHSRSPALPRGGHTSVPSTCASNSSTCPSGQARQSARDEMRPAPFGPDRAARAQLVLDRPHGVPEVLLRPRPTRRIDAGLAAQASTASPESSANAGSPDAGRGRHRLDACVFAKACSGLVGLARPSSPAETASIPYGTSSSRISRNLPALWVAITTTDLRCQAESSPMATIRQSAADVHLQIGACGRRQLTSPPFSADRRASSRPSWRARADRELLLGERHLLRRALHLDDPGRRRS